MNTAIYGTTSSDIVDNDYRFSPKRLVEQLQNLKRNVQLKLASSSTGRIMLHLLLAVMTCRFAWHFHGIARELVNN